MVLAMLVLLLAEEASFESAMAMIVLLQEAQWCSLCWCYFSRRRHRLGQQ